MRSRSATSGPTRPRALLRRLGAPERVVRVDVDDPASLAAALDGTEVVLNATYMRHNVPVTDAAIAAGAHLVDLGSYYPETLQQLDRHAAAERGRLPDRARLRRRSRPHQHPRAPGRRPAGHGRERPHLLLHHPPAVDVAGHRRDAVRRQLRHVAGLRGRPPGGARRRSAVEQRVVFPEPYGEQEVHLVPHPEPVTLPRSIDVRNVVFKVGYPADETRRIRVLMELGFDSDEPFDVDGVAIAPRRFAAAYIGRRGIAADDRSANVKQVCVDGAARRASR